MVATTISYLKDGRLVLYGNVFTVEMTDSGLGTTMIGMDMYVYFLWIMDNEVWTILGLYNDKDGDDNDTFKVEGEGCRTYTGGQMP